MWNSPSWTSSAGCAPPAPTWELPNSRNWAGEQHLSGSPSSTARSSLSPGLRGTGERGAEERNRKGCCCVLPSPPCCVSGKLSSLSGWQRHSHWRGYGWDLEGEGFAINPVPLVQNAIASSFVVPILFFDQHFFTRFFLPLINSCWNIS